MPFAARTFRCDGMGYHHIWWYQEEKNASPGIYTSSVHCPSCNSESRVIDSRPASDGVAVRRRRECNACARRFTTYERYERGPLSVRKRSGEREPFDRAKLIGGLLRATHKRPIEVSEVEALVDGIAAEVEAAGGEIDAERIGELALRGLRHLDQVAYIRFASVYKQFGDVAEFESELARLESDPSAQETALFGGSGGAGSVRSDSKDQQLPRKALLRGERG